MKMKEIAKKVTVSLLAIAMLMLGVSVSKAEVEAAAYPYEDEIQYISEIDGEFEADVLYNSNQAPEIPGYVFGGWFSDDKGKNQIISETVEEGTKLYAKFVPAYVLSVKAQNYKGVNANSTSAKLRLISAVDDDAHYQKVGFDIYFGNRTDTGYVANAEGTKVYSKITVIQDDQSKNIYEPKQAFGEQAAYFNIAEIENIGSGSFKSTIYVKPYWVTNDGTKVYGLGKYVCVQDGIDGIISIPINLSTAQKIAAGKVKVSYPENLTCYIDEENNEKGYVAGRRLLSEMAIKIDEKNHKIMCVGNAESVSAGNLAANSDLYVSLRFKAASGQTVTVGETRLNFTIESTEFCNWEEQPVEMSDFVWDIQY